MQQYSYKNSGIEWLGEIPEHWRINRLFGICSFIRGNSTFEKNDLLSNGKYVALQYGKTYKVEEVNEEFDFYVNEEFYKSSQTVDFGDVIFVSTSETIEDLGHSVFYNRKDIGLIGGEQILLKPNKSILDGKYLFYASKVIGKQLNKFATGIKVFRFDIYDLKTFYLPLPPLPEQKAIADYLDKACARIDRIIAIKEEQLRKIKDVRKSKIDELVCFGYEANPEISKTGLSYLPKIKKGWSIDRFKDVATLRDQKTDEKSELLDYLELEDIEQGTGNILGKRDTLEVESKITLFYKGDVLFGKLRPYLEKYHYAEFDGKCTGEILAFRPNRINGKFLKYIVGSKWFIDLCNSMSYGAKMPRVNWNTQLAMVNLPIPSPEEQNMIVKQLDELSEKVDLLKHKVINQISSLQSYRKSLIHECVTGKKQVYTGDIKTKETATA